jgi:hypothetical protein
MERVFMINRMISGSKRVSRSNIDTERFRFSMNFAFFTTIVYTLNLSITNRNCSSPLLSLSRRNSGLGLKGLVLGCFCLEAIVRIGTVSEALYNPGIDSTNG